MTSTVFYIGLVLIFIGIVMLIIGIVMYNQYKNPQPPAVAPLEVSWWVWFLIVGGIILLIVGVIMMIWGWSTADAQPILVPQVPLQQPMYRPVQQAPTAQVIHVAATPHPHQQFVSQPHIVPQQQFVQPQMLQQGVSTVTQHPDGGTDVTRTVGHHVTTSATPVNEVTHSHKTLVTGPTTVSSATLTQPVTALAQPVLTQNVPQVLTQNPLTI